MQESLPPVHITCSAVQRERRERATQPVGRSFASSLAGALRQAHRVGFSASLTGCGALASASHGIAPPRAELRVAHAFDASRKGPCPRPPPLAAPPSLLPLHSLSSTSLLTMPRGRPRLQASYDGDSDSACSSSASSSGDDLNARGAPGDSAAKSARQRTGGPGKGVQAKEKDFDASDAGPCCPAWLRRTDPTDRGSAHQPTRSRGARAAGRLRDRAMDAV